MIKKEFLGLAILVGVVYFFPWKNISWGKITIAPERTVTVTGYAESKVTNQIANFSAGVSAFNDKKEVAVNEINTKMTAIIAEVKALGVGDADIQTSQVNVYQMQESVVSSGRMMPAIDTGKVKLGQWSASNSIEIVLRNVDKASELTDILNKSGATNVYGPNFSLDTSSKASDLLIGAAIENSKVKANVIATSGGAKLGKMISVNEGYSSPNVYPMMAKTMMDSSVSVPAPVEIGSTNVSKTVTVVWGLE